MSKIENFKEKVKENKGKIIASSVFIAGVAGAMVWQGYKIKNLRSVVTEQDTKIIKLETIVSEQQDDINLLRHVMDGTVLASLKTSLTRQLRYREGKLNNAITKNSGMSQADETKLREEIEYFSGELLKILDAEKLLNNKQQRD